MVVAGDCQGLRDVGFGSELGPESREHLPRDRLGATQATSTAWLRGRLCPLEMAEQQLVPFAEQGKARAREIPSSEPNDSSARQRKKSGIKSILPASPLIDGEPGVLASPCSGFGGV